MKGLFSPREGVTTLRLRTTVLEAGSDSCPLQDLPSTTGETLLLSAPIGLSCLSADVIILKLLLSLSLSRSF